MRDFNSRSFVDSWEEPENFLSDPTAFKSRVPVTIYENDNKGDKENSVSGKHEDFYQSTFERMHLERETRIEQIGFEQRGPVESDDESRRLMMQTSSFDPLDEMLFTNSFVSESDITSMDIKKLEEEDDMLRVYKQTLFHQLHDLRKMLNADSGDKEVSSATKDIETLLKMEEDTYLITLDSEMNSLDSDFLKIDETLIEALAQVPMRKLRDARHRHQMDEEALLLEDIDEQISDTEEQARLMVEQHEERIRFAALEKMMEAEDDISIIATQAEQTLQEATAKAYLKEEQKRIAKKAKRALRRAKKEASARKEKRRELSESATSTKGSSMTKRLPHRKSSEPSIKATEIKSPCFSETIPQSDLEQAAEIGRHRAEEAISETVRSAETVLLRELCAKEAAFVATQTLRIRRRDECALEVAAVARLRLNATRAQGDFNNIVVVKQQTQNTVKIIILEQDKASAKQEETELTSSTRGLDDTEKSASSNRVKYGLLATVALMAGYCIRTARKSN